MFRSRQMLLWLAALVIIVAGALALGGASPTASGTGPTRVSVDQAAAPGHELALPAPSTTAKAALAPRPDRPHPALLFWVTALVAALLALRSHLARPMTAWFPPAFATRTSQPVRGPPNGLIAS